MITVPHTEPVPTVYVVMDDGRKDLSRAKEFGQLVPIFNFSMYPDDAEYRAPRMLTTIKSVMRDFKHDRDFILASGDPAYLMAVGFAIGSILDAPYFTLLKWDGKEGAYYPIQVTR